MSEALNIPVARTGAALIALSSRSDEVVVALNRPVLLIGSSSRVHLKLRGETVEPIHAVILNLDGRVGLFDLHTQARVIVNEEQVSEAVLQDGDVVQVGRVGFRYSAGPEDQSPSATSEGAPSPPPPAAVLRQGRTTHELQGQFVLIGRKPQCDIIVSSTAVRDKHALLFAAGGTWFVRSLDLHRRVVLNDEEIVQRSLRNGDVLRIAHAEMQYVESTGAVSGAALAAQAARAVPTEAGVPERLEGPPPAVAQAAMGEGVPVLGAASAAAAPAAVAAGNPAQPAETSRVPDIETDDVAGAHDAEEIETINLDDVRAWGPLALAVAADQRPELLRHVTGQHGAEGPESRRSLWIALACAGLVIVAALVALLIYW